MNPLASLLASHGLAELGRFHPAASQRPDPECRTLLLIGPDGLRFWPLFRQSPEYGDGQPDPLDRWSRRVVGSIADQTGSRIYFPFGGPPYRPFYDWALASGQAWVSPVRLLVHVTQGLGVSYRAALAFDALLPLPAAAPRPCDTCTARPCLAACPALALTGNGYDVPRCHAFLDRTEGADCLGGGCLVRRACPAGQADCDRRRAAFHMAAFHPGKSQ